MHNHETGFKKPKDLEYPEHFRPGMGTESVGPFLRSMVQLLRPQKILEIGAGYTTPFLLEGIVSNLRVFDDGNLDNNYFNNYSYDPKLIIIDDMSLGDLKQRPGMLEIVTSPIVNFEEGQFQGKAKQLEEKYGKFDFVWFDCGGPDEYSQFLEEYWEACDQFMFFHFTYLKGKPNRNLQAIRSKLSENDKILDIIEPHKFRQGSITIVQKMVSSS